MIDGFPPFPSPTTPMALLGLYGAVTASPSMLSLVTGEPDLNGIIEDDIPTVHSILGLPP